MIDEYRLEEKNDEATVFFARKGLQTKLIRRLKQGKLGIDDQLDLHGLKWIEAETALEEFLMTCQSHGDRVVLIIPGKGQVLKSNLNHMLRQLDHVLAFCTAQPRHGGTGAFYVLLKLTSD